MSSRIPFLARIVVPAAVALAVLVAPVQAEPMKCQREIAKRAAKFVRTKGKMLQKCEDKVLKGRLMPPCPDARTAEKIAKAESKMRAVIAKRCGGADRTCGTADDDALGAIGWDMGACPDFEGKGCTNAIADCDGIGECLACVGHAAVDQASELAYGALAPTSNPVVHKCQRTIGKAAAKFFDKTANTLSKCEGKVLKGKISGPCPDGNADGKVTKAAIKLAQKICKACGGGDRTCGTGDDLDVGTIGFTANCPDVTAPSGEACGGPVGDLASLVACVRCVERFKADCTDALSVPGLVSYPEECGGDGGPGATPTPPPAMTPTPTATATPNNCGDNILDPGEDCDGTADGACPGLCLEDCTCAPPCVLPDPLPDVLGLVSRPGGLSDSGWTGIAHDQPTADNGILGAMRLSNCNTDPNSLTCGQCDMDGPVSFPGGGNYCFCFDADDPDPSSLSVCDPEEAPDPCTAPESCECFDLPPLPLVTGGIPVCTVQRYATPVTGTANVAESGAHAGEIEFNLRLDAIAHNGLSIEQPCPTCENDVALLDGNRDGTCSGGPNDGNPCDSGATTPFYGELSVDCPPPAASQVGNLGIILEPETTNLKTLPAGVPCTSPGWQGFDCYCDTCATPEAEPCRTDADCPSTITCGGKRCIAGSTPGTPCTAGSDCPGGGFCGRPGQPTGRNACSDGICSPDFTDPVAGEGACENGPFDGNCSLEPFRTCLSNSECNPAPAGSCTNCAPGQECIFTPRECSLDPIVRQGVPGTTVATFVGAYCIAPTTASAINQVPGIPGQGVVDVPVQVYLAGTDCGNGVLDANEECDAPQDGACPGTCEFDCQCPTCGDGRVNVAGEDCDGADDGACPGACQPDCTCSAGVCGNDIVDFGEECDGTADAACPGNCLGDCTCSSFCGDNVVDAGEECDGAGSVACPIAACQPDCTCGPFCGDGNIDAGEGEECDGTNVGTCPGTCGSDCLCAPVCGDDVAQVGELCDGTDDAACPGECTMMCTCPALGEIEFFIEDGADLDAGWSGIVHDAAMQRGSRIWGQLANCDGQTDFDCDYFGNIGSFCSADPSRACTRNEQCSGAGSCVLQHLGPPLPVSAGGVPACAVVRFSTDATGTYDLQTGETSFGTNLNVLAHLGLEVSQPCPICDCGKPDTQDCEIGETGTCAGAGIIAGGPCTVEGTGPLGPTSLDCPPSSSLNVTGNGLDLEAPEITTQVITWPSDRPCEGSGFGDLGCWCEGQTQPNDCLNACDGGSNNLAACDNDGQCPGGACVPLCAQIVGEAPGEGECVAGPIEETCSDAPEISCTATSGCPAGTGTCTARNQRCFTDPIIRAGTPSTTDNTLAATLCVPATGGAAIDQTAGLPGPTTLLFDSTVTAALCGDGINNRAMEECDGTDDLNCPGACLPNCTCDTECGNNIVEFGEQCDGINDTACPGECAAPGGADECTCPPVCGDGFRGPDEQCDPGGPGGTPPPDDAACPGTCLAASCQCPLPPIAQCGNQVLDEGEVCDLPATGCGPLQACLLCTECFPPPDLVPADFGNLCGNLVMEPLESCELPAMGCPDSHICDPQTCMECIELPVGPVCGNLNIESGELCELPGAGCAEGEVCLACQQCIPAVPICGNLKIEAEEACELPAIGCGIAQVCLACLQCIP